MRGRKKTAFIYKQRNAVVKQNILAVLNNYETKNCGFIEK